jgi:hypothetical protein
LEASDLDVFARSKGLNVALSAKRLEIIEAEVERDLLSGRRTLAAAEILGDVVREVRRGGVSRARSLREEVLRAKVLGSVKSYFSTTTLFVFHGSFPFFNLD